MSAGETAARVGTTDHAVLQERLWGAVVDGDEYAAGATVFAAIDDGIPAEEVLLDVIAPVQRRVGAEWAANRMTVAQEHVATAINDRVIAALAHHPATARTADAGRVVVACVDGEWHALPARLLAEVLRLRGWHVDFLGAQVPTPHLIAHLHQHAPDAVALSCSIPTRLPMAHAAITACQAAGASVLAGGAAFGRDGRYARLLGADGWAPDARAAADRLAQGFSRSHQSATHQAIDDLPHLADQEYTMVSGMSRELVRVTLRELMIRLPEMQSYSDLQRQHTAEDVAHVVDYLVTAVYTGDEELFSDFILWTADVLAARGVPAASLVPALDILGAQLRDFPRTLGVLHAARTALDSTNAECPS